MDSQITLTLDATIKFALLFLGVVGSLISTILGFGFNWLKKEWRVATDRLVKIENITSVQAENHLRTIQDESLKQTALLQEVVKGQTQNNAKLEILCEVISSRNNR
jgi:hypothetical protein